MEKLCEHLKSTYDTNILDNESAIVQQARLKYFRK